MDLLNKIKNEMEIIKLKKLIAVYLEEIATKGMFGFDYFEYEEDAEGHFKKVQTDIVKYKKESVYKAVKRIVDYNEKRNSVSF